MINQIASASLHCDSCDEFLCEIAATGSEFKVIERIKVTCKECGGKSIKTEDNHENKSDKSMQGLHDGEAN